MSKELELIGIAVFIITLVYIIHKLEARSKAEAIRSEQEMEKVKKALALWKEFNARQDALSDIDAKNYFQMVDYWRDRGGYLYE